MTHPSIERATNLLKLHGDHIGCSCDAISDLLHHVSNLETTLNKQADELRDVQGLLDEYKRTLNEIATSYYHDAHAIKARAAIGGA